MALPDKGRILVSGASIAGPTVGYWLARHGFDVDIVERAAQIRGGGYPIDIRGSAVGVVERFGILPQIRAKACGSRTLSIFDGNGDLILHGDAEKMMGSPDASNVEIARGDLSSLLYETSREMCSYRFNERIQSLEQSHSKVYVQFASGAAGEYDYVIGADGLHSSTRQFVFGDEAKFLYHMGYCFVGFSMPNIFDIENETLTMSTVKRMAAVGHSNGSDRAFCMFAIADESITVTELNDPFDRQAIVRRYFGDYSWYIPSMMKYLELADDVFADTVSQTRLPFWSKGRVALIGDAAHAPGFVTGQGTSLALASAYVLAGELATNFNEPATALASYEREARPYVEANQNLTSKNGALLIPIDKETEQRRNDLLRTRGIPDTRVTKRPEIHNLINLKNYENVRA